MRILIAGASGFIGSNLASFLHLHGCDIYCLVRQKNLISHTNYFWDPQQGILEPWQLEGFDAVINLAGQSIQSLHWTENKKKEIIDSRVNATALLCRTAVLCKRPPKRILSASAVGYYGNCGSTLLDERSEPGKDFLSEVCVRWESATEPANFADIPVTILRFGIVLSRHGGALPKMILPFSLGLGGKMGNGQQYMSWIALEDLLHIILFLLQKQEPYRGPINIVAPRPVTNLEFTKTLGKVLHRPTFCTVPASVIKLLFGQMGEELFLSSTRAYPKKCIDFGYKFLYSNLNEALQIILQK